MEILAFNASPRPKGNTSHLVSAILEGARSQGVAGKEVRLHDLNTKGCRGCLGCRKTPGICHEQDDLSPYLEAIKNCRGMVIATPIYMYRIAGQMKLLVDRFYSLYGNKEGGGYYSTVAPGKTYAIVISQGAPDPAQYERSIRYLMGMTGTGLGFEVVGKIIHANSHVSPAEKDEALLAQAYEIGQRMAK
ncbi:MAG: flavodoxin family protein [Syntrophales bacterium]|nr:flavodoxin family protein [Syntrophales bacterium]